MKTTKYAQVNPAVTKQILSLKCKDKSTHILSLPYGVPRSQGGAQSHKRMTQEPSTGALSLEASSMNRSPDQEERRLVKCSIFV